MSSESQQLPNALINSDGSTFGGRIDELERALTVLSNRDRCRYRDRNAEEISQIEARRLLIVAGPGSGKTTLFFARIQIWLASRPESSIYVSSFVRKLVKDLETEIQEKAGLSEQEQHRVRVTTLHSLARGLLERNLGTINWRLRRGMKVISSEWPGVVWRDVQQFHDSLNRATYTLRKFERQYHTEEFDAEPGWAELRATYTQLSRFYNAVGFPEMIVLGRLALEERPDLNQHDLWIIDEFQDFNRSEEHLIRTITATADGVLIAGDDDQALYQDLKVSLPDIIIEYYNDPGVANAMLPYCGRCSYYVCLAASAFIAKHRQGSAIVKIYLPLALDEAQPKISVVAAPTPKSAVDYIREFLDTHKTDLDAHQERMESGSETDPFLLILTPERNVRFFKPGGNRSGADEELRLLIRPWSSKVDSGHSSDYWRTVAYYRVAMDDLDNFAVRKVLHLEGLSAAEVHPMLEQAMERRLPLARVAKAASYSHIFAKCNSLAVVIDSQEFDDAEKVQRLEQLISIRDPDKLREELTDDPIGQQAEADEGEEAIETAGTGMAPVELMTLFRAKGLSAKHVIVIGVDDVNMRRVSSLTFYVALTRARSSLHLITALKARGSRAVHPFVLDLPERCCEYIAHTTTRHERLPNASRLVRQLQTWTRAATRRA